MTELKQCKKCEEYKPATDGYFSNNWKSKDGLDYWCKICSNNYRRNLYHKSNKQYKQKLRRQQLALINRNKEYVYSYLQKHPCVDCGETNIGCLEFDHVIGVKKYNISELINSAASLQTIDKEISKCLVRCANCHRLKTNSQFGYYKTIFVPQSTVIEKTVIPYGEKVIARFNKYIEYGSNDHDCHLWCGAKNNKNKTQNVGIFRLSEKDGTISAHRFSYLINFGPIPDGYIVNHTCTNTLCVNPKHLVIGTKQDNARLREVKRKGTIHYNSSLTKEQVSEIRESNLSQSKLALIYGVSRTTIHKILYGKTYKRIT